MKTILTFLAGLLFFSITSNAQPVLNAADLNPKPGDKFIQVGAKIANVKIPAAGASRTWNYTKLKDSTLPNDTFKYVKAINTPYAALFPKANLAGVASITPGAYTYYKTSSKSLQSFGTASPFDTTTWAPPYRLVVYPSTYGTNFTDTCTITSKTGGTVMMEGYRDSSKVVGYGTLKLPNSRIFTNVLMIRTTTIFTFKIFNQTFVTKNYSLSFFVAGYHNPLITFSLDKNNKLTFITYSKDAIPSFSDVAAGEDDAMANNNNTALTIFPNPASSSVTVKFNSLKKATALIITDLNGNTVYTQKENIASGQRINCASLKEGNYLLRLRLDDGSTAIQKLEIRK